MWRIVAGCAACLLWAGNAYAESCAEDPEKPKPAATQPDEPEGKGPAFYWQMSLDRIQIGQYDQADRSLGFFLKLKPKDGFALYARSYCWMMQRDYGRALGLLTVVVPKVPTKEVGYNGGVLFKMVTKNRKTRRKAAALSARFSAAAQGQPYVLEGLKEGVAAYETAHKTRVRPLIASIKKQIDTIKTRRAPKKRILFKTRTEYEYQRDKAMRWSAEMRAHEAEKAELEDAGQATAVVDGKIKPLKAKLERQADVVRRLYVDMVNQQDEVDAFETQIEDLKKEGTRSLHEIELSMFKFDLDAARNEVVELMNSWGPIASVFDTP